jgi:hypothetical protein
VSVVLSGQVRTEFGKQDAEQKVRDFLHVARLEIHNKIAVNAQLASRPEAEGPGPQITLPAAFRGCWKLVSDRRLEDIEGFCGTRKGGVCGWPSAGTLVKRSTKNPARAVPSESRDVMVFGQNNDLTTITTN